MPTVVHEAAGGDTVGVHIVGRSESSMRRMARAASTRLEDGVGDGCRSVEIGSDAAGTCAL